MTEAPLEDWIHRETVKPEWIDYNGHMNVAYYTLTFDHATDALYDHLGAGLDYVQQRGCSLFSAESHTLFRREVRVGYALVFSAQLLDHDAYRLHVFLAMHLDQGDRPLVATIEFVATHVDLSTRRAAPFPADLASRIAALAARHATHERPAAAGRAVAIRRKTSP